MYLCSENRGADVLRGKSSYPASGLCLFFPHMQKAGFLMTLLSCFYINMPLQYAVIFTAEKCLAHRLWLSFRTASAILKCTCTHNICLEFLW